MTAPTSPAPANLAAALARVQAELPKLERDRTVVVQQKNGDTYSYSYATLANLSETVLPLLAKHGLSFVAMPGAGADGKMAVRYHLLHESGETLSGEFPISGEGGIQMIGGRITYARRYCLAAIVGVAADEDDEARLADEGARGTAQRAAAPQRQPAPRAQPGRPQAQRATTPPAPPPLPGEDGKVDPAQHRKMHALWRELGYGGEENRDNRLTITSKIVKREIDSSATLTYDEATTVIQALESRARSAKAAPGGEG